MKVRDKVVPVSLYLRPEQTVFTAREMMVLNEVEYLYVIDAEGRPVGEVTTLAVSVESPRTKIKKVMNTEIVVVEDSRDLMEAAKIFASAAYQRPTLPVVDEEGKFVGVVRVADLVGGLGGEDGESMAASFISPERAAVRLAMTLDKEQERSVMEKIRELNYVAAVTQVGATAERLPIKMREAAVVAAIAHGVIKESGPAKVAVSNAIRDVLNQMDVVSPGLGGGYKLGIVRGEGRVVVCAVGRSGHALSSSPEQVFLGCSIV